MFGNENLHVATIEIEAVLNGIHAKKPKAVLTSASHRLIAMQRCTTRDRSRKRSKNITNSKECVRVLFEDAYYETIAKIASHKKVKRLKLKKHSQ